ncbi:MAG: DUF4350 domain-containing protein [Ignavibacteriae bacterium]|nr:DUF4350 domain-containing protein [Ignavibacteriota bacterium]
MRRFLPLLPLVAVLVLMTLLEMLKPKPLDWTPSFSSFEKIPWGTYALYEMLDDLFSRDSIRLNTNSLYESLDTEEASSHQNIIIIAERFHPDELDATTLLEFAAIGNDVFLAAEFFSPSFQDSLGFSIKPDYTIPDSVVCMLEGDSAQYPSKVSGLPCFFAEFDTANTQVLGTDGKNKPIFLRTHYGAGFVYLHSVPWVFTNYNFLKNGNDRYVGAALSHLASGPTIWDEYYRDVRNEVRSPLAFVLSKAALSWAYVTALVGVLLFVVVEGKRKQRIIPVLPPLRNETLSFVDTLARLYFHNAHHKDVAVRMRLYFFDFVRSRYNIGTERLDDAFISTLSNKCGMIQDDLRRLVGAMTALDAHHDLATKELMRLNKHLEHFYEQCRKI